MGILNNIKQTAEAHLLNEVFEKKNMEIEIHFKGMAYLFVVSGICSKTASDGPDEPQVEVRFLDKEEQP